MPRDAGIEAEEHVRTEGSFAISRSNAFKRACSSHLVTVWDGLSPPLPVLPPLDEIDAFGMDLGMAIDPNSVPEFPVAFDHYRTKLP
jgi:hypothetical protein